MKQLVLGLALLTCSVAAWTAEPCCAVTVVNARTGSVTLVDNRTGQVIRFQAEPTSTMGPQNGVTRAGVNALKVGDMVDLIGGQLQTETGATIEGRVQR